MTSPTNTSYFDDAQSVRQPIPVTSAKSRRLSREASDSASNRPTLVRVNAPTVQRAQVRATGRKGVAMQASDSRLERRYTFYGHHTPPHLLQPRHRTSLTLQVGREFERLLPPRFDLDLDRDFDRSRPRSRHPPRKVVVGRSYSYSARTGTLDDFEEDTDEVTSPQAGVVEGSERVVAVVATPTGGRGAPFPREDEWEEPGVVVPARRQSYSAWKRLKVTSSSQRLDSDDDVFVVRARSRSAPQSPTTSPLLSPTSDAHAWHFQRRLVRSQSLPRNRYMSSPDKLDFYRICWRQIRSEERQQDEEMW